MKEERKEHSPWFYLVLYIAIGFVVGSSALLCTSCSPRIIERIAIQRDTTYIVRRDSITFYDRDSIFVKEKGDTVYKYVEKWRYRDRVRVDTILRSRVDSVYVDRIKEVKVEKPLSWWQKAKIGAFPWLLLACCAAVVYIFRKPIWAFIKTILKI